MRNVLRTLAGTITAFLLLVAPTAGATSPPRTQTWDMQGVNTIDFVCSAVCVEPAVPHLINITWQDWLTGAFSGTGYYTEDPTYTWTVTGQVTGDTVAMHILYTGTNAGYYVDAVGTIDSSGHLSGTATDSIGQPFTWNATSLVPATDYNHGQFVSRYADKQAMAQSTLGMPATN